MKSLIIIAGLFLFTVNAFPQHVSTVDSTTAILADTSVNLGWGVYRVCPLLSHKKKLKIINELKSLSTMILEYEQELSVAKDSLALKMNADTASVRKHVTFVGGLFTVPALTPSEKQTVKSRRKLYAEKLRIEEQEMKIEELKLKKSQLEESLLANKKKLQRRYLWGLGITLKDRFKNNS